MERGRSQTDSPVDSRAECLRTERTRDDVLLDWAQALLRSQPDSIVSIIETGLGHAAQAVGGCGAGAFRMSSSGDYVELVYQWRLPSLPPMREARYHKHEIPETFCAFLRGEPIILRPDDPGTDHPHLRAVLVEQATTGTMAFPLQEAGVTTWVVVFEWRDTRPSLDPEMVAFGKRATSLLHAGLFRESELTHTAEAQAKLLERQKLETLGVMAGGIVHDFNNVLQAVLGLSEMLKAQLEPGSPQEQYASMIASSATRAADLTHRFLVFSRQGVRQRKIIPVAEALNNTLKLLRRSIPENRRLRLSAECPFSTVYMAPIDFEQAIVNLCHNASAAMPSGGNIDIECNVVGDGTWVEITVRDEGVGMTPEQLAKACDVFYTTKAPGEGTGLGLPMVKRTVEAAGGHITLESTPGRGTTVRLTLPKSMEAEAADAEVEEPPVTGHETVLVVEDDPAVRRVAATQLEKAGFTVLQASDGERALTLFRKHRDQIAAVLTDVIMPGLGGMALYEAMAAEGRPPPFLFATGYDAGTLSADFLSGPDRDFLSKPYPAKQMLRRIRHLIDARASEQA